MDKKSIPKQFMDNLGIITNEDYKILNNLTVLIVGLGGLGGNFVNNLVRLGVKKIFLVDFDSFEEQNLNRQLFSNIENVAKNKVDVITKELMRINVNCIIESAISRIQELPLEKLKDVDYIIDAVDNIETKIYLAELGNKLNIPVLHGACAGWYGQVGWILPGNELIKETYGQELYGLEKEYKNPSFTPAVVASIMVAEFIKMIQKSKNTVINQLLLIDLYNNTLLKSGKNKDNS